jgi:hypothetical protein
MSYTFDPSYVVNTLVPALDNTVLNTELGGDATSASKFSFAGGTSSYSFGLYQYDVKNNPAARALLTQFGFTSAQITLLSQNGHLSTSQQNQLTLQLRSALNNPANAASMAQFNSAWAQGLITQMTNVLNLIAASGPVGQSLANQVFASTALQVQIIDYGNQFHLDVNGYMQKFLSGNLVNMVGGKFQLTAGTVLTKDMLRQFTMSTEYGVTSAAAETTRENALYNSLSSIPAGDPSSISDATTSGLQTPQVIVHASTGLVEYVDAYGNVTTSANSVLDSAAEAAQSGAASTPGSADGTAAGYNVGDGGDLIFSYGTGSGIGSGGDTGTGTGGFGGGGGEEGGGGGGGGDGGDVPRDENSTLVPIEQRTTASISSTANKSFTTGSAAAPSQTPTVIEHSTAQLIQSMASFQVPLSTTSSISEQTYLAHNQALGVSTKNSIVRHAI